MWPTTQLLGPWVRRLQQAGRMTKKTKSAARFLPCRLPWSGSRSPGLDSKPPWCCWFYDCSILLWLFGEMIWNDMKCVSDETRLQSPDQAIDARNLMVQKSVESDVTSELVNGKVTGSDLLQIPETGTSGLHCIVQVGIVLCTFCLCLWSRTAFIFDKNSLLEMLQQISDINRPWYLSYCICVVYI